jgi:hypothetical protein
MKRLNKFVAALCVVAALAACSPEAFAKSGAAKQRLVSGSIVRIDRDARTMVVRDSATNREVVVRVPAGACVKTSYLSGAPVSFELLLRGMSVRGLAVE